MTDLKIGSNCIFPTNPDGGVLWRLFWGVLLFGISIYGMTL